MRVEKTLSAPWLYDECKCGGPKRKKSVTCQPCYLKGKKERIWRVTALRKKRGTPNV